MTSSQTASEPLARRSPVLVTGGQGFIGRHVVRRLLADGCEVRVLDVSPQGPDESVPQAGVFNHHGSILDPTAVSEAVRGAEGVIHLAARVANYGPRAEFERLNVDGTRVVAEAARAAGVRRFVFMSSVAVFDYRRGFRDADESVEPGGHRHPYGQSKRAAEALLHAMNSSSFEVTVLRPGLLPYGPGDRAGTLGLLRSIAQRAPVLIDNGEALLSTSYVDNLVDGVLLALRHPRAAGETFHVTDDVAVSWRAFVGEAARSLGVTPNLAGAPAWLLRPVAAVVEALYRVFATKKAPPLSRYLIELLTHDLHFSSRKAKTLLGYAPRVGLADGLTSATTWVREIEARDASRASNVDGPRS